MYQACAYLRRVTSADDFAEPRATLLRPGQLLIGIAFVNAEQQGLLVQVDWLGFPNAADALPAVAEWLCGHRCATLKYELHSPWGSTPDEDE